MLLTIVMKHHAGLTLEDVQSRMKASGWWERFPPEGVRIVSWTVAMGLGQIVTLELPPELLPVVNLEQRAFWTPDPVPVGGRGWWTRGYLWAHTLAGWALGLLAIAGFSGLVKSD